jgi:hypothetical protein
MFLAGCAGAPPSPTGVPHPAISLPADGFITQRAVLSIRGRQFPLNGYLAVSETGGKRLVVTENFGQVVADVLVQPDGEIRVMQSSQMLTADSIRRGMAVDMQSLFGGVANEDCPVELLGPDHFLVKRRAYTLDLRILEVKTGLQPAALFDASKAKKE